MFAPVRIIKTQDQNVLGTTLVLDNELHFTADAGSKWALHLDLMTSADDVYDENGRAKLAIIAPSGATATVRCFLCNDDGLNDISNGANTQFLLPGSQGTPGSSFAWGGGGTANPAFAWVRIACHVEMGSTPGIIGLQFAEYASVSDSTGHTVYAGSQLFAQRSV